MLLQHPRDPPPAAVDCKGDLVSVARDGTFRLDNRPWARRFAARHGVALADIVVDDTLPDHLRG
jgi:hypothetical protein